MSTKYKYGENGPYFDPETKRTYYKDPQYQKAYDNEWNRLEKLYKMRQEEQRKIEMANFQRVLTQADALRKSLRASGIAPTPQPWTPYRNEFKKGGSTKSDGGYYEYMEKVAENNAAKWKMSEEEALLHLLNDPTYNYKAYYEANKTNPNLDSDNHWTDTYKTAYHPTFSDESIYSGKQSQYNPNSEVGGSWVGNSDILYPSYMWNPEVAHYIEQGKEKNRFDGTEDSEIERAPEDKIYITENSLTGKDEYIRGNGHPVSFDKETGELIDAITDERTSFDTKLPQEVVITGKKRYNPVYMSSPSAPIPLPGILSSSTEDYLKAADNTASAFSAAKWMDTAYDAMYTPDEINMPWDEGNKGLGNPMLDLGFDFATGLGLSKLANLSKFANALDNGVNSTKRVDKGVNFIEDNVNKLLKDGIKFDRVPFNKPGYRNPQFMSDLIYDLEHMSGRQYLSTSMAKRWADGILYEDMMDYSPMYRRFIGRLSPYNKKIIERTPMYPLTDYPYTIKKRKGSWFSPADNAILLDPEYYNTYNPFSSYANNIGNTATHEGVHSIVWNNPEYSLLRRQFPTSLDMAEALKVDITNVPMTRRQAEIFEYLFENGGEEIITRGSEFKNVADTKYFETAKQLQDAMKLKEKMHNNHISDLYTIIDKYGDWKTFRDFINKSPAVIPATIVTTQAIQSNNSQNK